MAINSSDLLAHNNVYGSWKVWCKSIGKYLASREECATAVGGNLGPIFHLNLDIALDPQK